MKTIWPARAPWSEVIVVCGKCARKAGRKRFAKEVKIALKAAGVGKTTRVVEVGCLDLCPKRRLTVATGRDLALGRLTVLAATAEPIDAVSLLASTLPVLAAD